MTRRRLDLELVRRGLADSRDQALDLIASGRVVVAGRPALADARLVAPQEPVHVEHADDPYASRGGVKLSGALDRLGIAVEGRRCLDAGASTGGFTDVLLARGAAQVVAADVGYGQLAWRLRTDERVTVLDRTNVRSLKPGMLPYAPDLVVADLSFISLRLAVPALVGVAAAEADIVVLVKPQFEAARADVGAGGVVRDAAVWRRAIESVANALTAAGAGPVAAVASPIAGATGNVEFFLQARVGGVPRVLDLEDVLREATERA